MMKLGQDSWFIIVLVIHSAAVAGLVKSTMMEDDAENDT